MAYLWTKAITACTLSSISKIICGAFLMILATSIRLPLPFSPVPLTFQTLAALSLGLWLGRSKGTGAVLIAALWSPFFLLGPTTGYILGFALIAFLAQDVKTYCKTPATFFAGLFALCLLNLCLGSLWIAFALGLEQAFWIGFYPFLLGEALKCMLLTTMKNRFTSPIRSI